MDQYYEVEDVVLKAYVQNEPYYKVKWKGYTDKDSTWEHQGNLNDLKSHYQKYTVFKNPLNSIFSMVEFGTIDELYQYDKVMAKKYRQIGFDDATTTSKKKEKTSLKILKMRKCKKKNSSRSRYQTRQQRMVSYHISKLQLQKLMNSEEIIKPESRIDNSDLQDLYNEREELQSSVLSQRKENHANTQLETLQSENQFAQLGHHNQRFQKVISVFQVYNPKIGLQKLALVQKQSNEEQEVIEKIISLDDIYADEQLMKLCVEYFVEEENQYFETMPPHQLIKS